MFRVNNKNTLSISLTPHTILIIRHSRNSRSQMFLKTGILKNFTILTGKHLCWSLFLSKSEGL